MANEPMSPPSGQECTLQHGRFEEARFPCEHTFDEVFYQMSSVTWSFWIRKCVYL